MLIFTTIIILLSSTEKSVVSFNFACIYCCFYYASLSSLEHFSRRIVSGQISPATGWNRIIQLVWRGRRPWHRGYGPGRCKGRGPGNGGVSPCTWPRTPLSRWPTAAVVSDRAIALIGSWLIDAFWNITIIHSLFYSTLYFDSLFFKLKTRTLISLELKKLAWVIISIVRSLFCAL